MLSFALQLTSLYVNGASYDDDLSYWRFSMPSLSHVGSWNSSRPLPAGVLLWPKLQHLEISCIEFCGMYDWVTGLTSLQSLVMHDCSFEFFPDPVLAMSQLHVLSFANMERPTMGGLPEKLMECASWPNLSVLDLTLEPGCEWDLESHVIVLLLADAFRIAGRLSSLVLDEAYTE